VDARLRRLLLADDLVDLVPAPAGSAHARSILIAGRTMMPAVASANGVGVSHGPTLRTR